MMSVEELIRKTDALTYLNSLKTALAELKEELSTIEETREYQTQAVERARKLMRRIDNQYRAVVKASHGYDLKDIDVDSIDPEVEELLNDLEKNG